MKNRAFILLIALLILTGIAMRLAPLLDEQRMVQSISEEGYLMMTIARNMALDLGMSTAEGTQPTNGTQPLVTFLWAAAYWLEQGDKIHSIVWIILIQLMMALAAAFLLWRGGLKILQHRSDKHQIAALAAATWFGSLVAAWHTMYGLETGLYGLAVIWIAILFSTSKPDWSLGYSILLGFMLGVTFLIRNDAALLILAVCLTHLLMGHRQQLFQRLSRIIVMGTTSVLVALPWLIYNQIYFGSIMPISGQSQTLNITYGQNLPAIPPILTEYFLVFLPIPHSLQSKLPIILACTVFLAGMIIMLSRLWRHLQTIERRLFVLVSLYLLGLVGFYGFYFGAGHFLPRYLFPLSPFLALLWATIVLWIWRRVPWQWVRYGLAGLFMTLFMGLWVHDFRKNNDQHFQVVKWVEEHVAEEEWVGAVQSGTLGYFHDRTINLDGKVNPEALAARKRSQLIEYVIEKRIDYLADWVGIAKWMDKHELIRQHFDVMVKDHQRNLAVLKRRVD